MILMITFQTYDWSKPVQEMILGAFFVGYCLMMFPTGIACQRYGGKLPLQMCLLINGIISIATPTVAVWVRISYQKYPSRHGAGISNRRLNGVLCRWLA
ncbi:hypothetical protein MSG28_014610 [Choristoneura fumiferana]|uniref:Uncharacterized protein n=1 Tax=Choristoneura fumiferana TaxID=7141 RepID=A0ACC0JSN7_CHOFU|nr:hypothetical protein MSG28_014610 [Choristoneura fumiferana]